MRSLRVVPVGGRVKAAGMGMSHLFCTDSPVEQERYLNALRNRPPIELLTAFFPSDQNRLRQMMRGIGFYRPVLKTDQGMPGNFLPFYIDPDLPSTTLVRRNIASEDFIAIPEPHADLSTEQIREIQERFFRRELHATSELLEGLGRREATRGRLPFFFIRPAHTDELIVFGRDIVQRVETAVENLVDDLCTQAGVEDARLIWAQPDVFILNDGTIQIERLNCPDVGMFLTRFDHPFSTHLRTIQEIVGQLHQAIRVALGGAITADALSVLTRDEVIDHEEDLLELGEIGVLCQMCQRLGKELHVRRLSDIAMIPAGEPVLLLNLDYTATGAQTLIDRVAEGSLQTYPDPRFQHLCQTATGLFETMLPPNFRQAFLQLCGSQPKNDHGYMDVLHRINERLTQAAHASPILYVQISNELVPVLRQSLHSWRQLKNRIERLDPSMSIRFRSVPADMDTLLLTGHTGPRMHVYRFMCVRTS